jgi:protein-disulfide isomerase
LTIRESGEEIMTTGSNRKRKDSTRSWMLLGAGAVFVVFLFALLVYSNQPRSAEEQTSAFELNRQLLKGDPNAPVTLIEFADFKCPVCKKFNDEIAPKIDQELIQTGKAKLYFINMPFIGPDSTTAALAALSVYKQDPKKFWTFYDLVFDAQGPEDQQWATLDLLLKLAKDAGLTDAQVSAVKSDVENKVGQADLDKNSDIAMKEHVTGTPSLFVNELFIKETFDFDKIKAAVEKATSQNGANP